jgi:hypothetical protein
MTHGLSAMGLTVAALIRVCGRLDWVPSCA